MTPTIFNKVWGALVLTFLVFWAFFLGLDVARGDAKQAIVDGIMLAFWAFFVIFWHVMALKEQKTDLEFKQKLAELNKETQSGLSDLLDTIKEDIDHDIRLKKALKQATEDTVGQRPPKGANEFKKVETRFHEITGDHYLKLTSNPSGKPDAEVSDEPFIAEPAKKAPVKKPAATKKPVTKKGK